MDQKETVQEYIEFIAYMEQHKRGICIAREKLCSEIDNVLKAKDSEIFFSLVPKLARCRNMRKEALSEDAFIVQLISQAMQLEIECQLPLFIWNTNSYEQLKNKYVLLNLMLRRIELNISGQDEAEAFAFIDLQKISPYSVQAVLYSMISILGHRQEVMMKVLRIVPSARKNLKNMVGATI